MPHVNLQGVTDYRVTLYGTGLTGGHEGLPSRAANEPGAQPPDSEQKKLNDCGLRRALR